MGAGDAKTLRELAEAFGVALCAHGGRLAGLCPRCSDDLAIDAERDQWSCGCGSGGPVELVAVFGGFSMSHAGELLSTGWRPERPSLRDQSAISTLGRTGSIRALPLACGPDADDQAILDAVLLHYQGARQRAEAATRWLKARGVDGALADELRIGFSDRTLGHRLPQANRKDGAVLRGRLLRLGVYRNTGHEHFRGCIVVPVLDTTGRIVQLYGRRVEPDRGPTEVWAAGLPGGLFIAGHGEEVMVRDNLPDALRALAASPTARVVAPGRPEGFLPEDQAAFAALSLANPPSLRGDHGDDRLPAAGPDDSDPEPSTRAVMPAVVPDGQGGSVVTEGSIPEKGLSGILCNGVI